MGAATPAPLPSGPALRRGDVVLLDWTPARGSEQAGTRPAVVVQNDAFNANPAYPNTVVVAVSKRGRAVPTHVELPRAAGNGLWEPVSYAKCEQLFTVSKDRLVRKLGTVTPEQIDAICRALKRVLSLP